MNLEDKDAPVTINGVVYNEMKGAFSSPEGVLRPCSIKFPVPGYHIQQ